jgi:hypothetical protein
VRSGPSRRECFRRGESVLWNRHDVSSGHARAHIFLPGKCYLYGREPASACPVPALHSNDGWGGVPDDWYLVGVFRLPFSVLTSFEAASPQTSFLLSSFFILIFLSFFLFFFLSFFLFFFHFCIVG